MPRERRIFTAISTSLSLGSRQCGSVTPFVQVGTYPTRNFATLGPLSLRPPFTGASIKSFALRLTPSINLPAPGRRDPILPLACSQSPVFLINSRSHRLPATFNSFGSKSLHRRRHTFFRSYGTNLQSSLTRVLSSALADYLLTHQCRFTVRSNVI